MFKIYENTIPGTNIHLILAFIILIEILIAFYNSILYLSRPNDKSRLKYLILTILFIQYNISGGLFVDERLPFPIMYQGSIAIFSSLLMSAYLPYYLYRTLNLKALRFFAYQGSIYFILLPYIFAFLIPLLIFKNYSLATKCYIVIPILYSFPFLYFLTKAFINEKRNNEHNSIYKNQLFTAYLAMLFWILMPIVFFFNGDQISEHLVSNIGYLIMSVVFIRKNIIDSRDEYNKLIQSEAELLKINKTLEQKVLQRTLDLEQLNKLRIETFINFAHETRTPLTFIKNNLDDYSQKYDDNLEINKIKYHVEKINQLIGNVLNIEKFEKGHDIYSHDKIIDISSFISIKLDHFSSYISKKNLKLISNIQKNIYLKIDPESFDSLLDNLLVNAIKFTIKGSITVSLFSKESLIFISIKDTGVGIPLNIKEKIFEPYFHFSNNPCPGFGMGLTIVENIVSSLQGKIIFNSIQDEGTEFLVSFDHYLQNPENVFSDYKINVPITESSNIIITDAIYDENKPYILVIEDNPELLLFLRDKLKDDFNVYVSSSCLSALPKIIDCSIKPDLIIADIMMEKMDGIQFFESLKETEYHYIPLIFVTAKTNTADRDKALTLGAIDFITKPFEISEVKQKVTSIINNSREQRQAVLNSFKSLLDSQSHKLHKTIVSKKNDFESNCVLYKISDREQDIIKLAYKGKTYNEIADALNISRKTVDTHFQNIFKKTEVNKLQELVNKLFN